MASVSPFARRSLNTLLQGRITRFQQLPPLRTTLKLPSPFQSTYLPAAAIPLLAQTTFSNLRDVLSSIWESILLAVPKKRTSYSRKRSRRLAGKALKDVTSLNYCSSCGRPKRAHFLCVHCVMLVRDIWMNNTTSPKIEEKKKAEAEEAKAAKDIARGITKPDLQLPAKPSFTERMQSIWRR